MRSRLTVWLPSLILWSVFAVWYGGSSDPLTEDEIEPLIELLRATGQSPEDVAMVKEFARNDTGKDFLMVNLIDMNETPPDVTGAKPGESAQELMGHYMGHMYPELLKRACHPVLAGPAVGEAMDVQGIEGAREWDAAALFRYRSRRDFLQIVSDPAFAGKHKFKLAALTKTIAYPIEPRLYFSDPRLLLGLVLLAASGLIDNARLSLRAKRPE